MNYGLGATAPQQFTIPAYTWDEWKQLQSQVPDAVSMNEYTTIWEQKLSGKTPAEAVLTYSNYVRQQVGAMKLFSLSREHEWTVRKQKAFINRLNEINAGATLIYEKYQAGISPELDKHIKTALANIKTYVGRIETFPAPRTQLGTPAQIIPFWKSSTGKTEYVDPQTGDSAPDTKESTGKARPGTGVTPGTDRRMNPAMIAGLLVAGAVAFISLR